VITPRPATQRLSNDCGPAVFEAGIDGSAAGGVKVGEQAVVDDFAGQEAVLFFLE
jgi:hypothetical protein